ncbi:MAG: putative zinc-binding metallopeptidase [Bacteroides sp.]|nr:putative zinc-binding metallopeptidase [Bacteroides sp.]
MKKYHLIYTLLILMMAGTWSSCSEDELDPTSVITTSGEVVKNEFDLWLEAYYVNTYNIAFKYRYEEIESDLDYYTVPADYTQSVEMAHILKYICIEAYDEIAGIDFTRAYFPKEFFLIGEWEYENNGTFILGTAEGGKKILLAGINYLDQYRTNINNLTHYYLKTIHHEFTHILNQTVDLPTAYQYITGDSYVADMWSEDPYDEDYLERGYISAYSQKEYSEDFAEMMSMYICYSEDQWEEWMEEAGDDGAELIDSKLTLVKQYMSESWGIDLDDLRDTIQRRADDLEAGKIDLTDLTIE